MSKMFNYFLISTLMLLVFTWRVWPDNDLHIVSCDVGQGDATLIYKRFTQVLIDAGSSLQVLQCLNDHVPWFDKNIEMAVITHPQNDHMGGMSEVVSSYDVGVLVANGIRNPADFFEDFTNTLEENDVDLHIPTMGDVYVVGDLKFSVLWPRKKMGSRQAFSRKDRGFSGENSVLGAYSGDLNEVSIVMLLEYGDVSALFTGDIGFREEQALLGMGVINGVDVLKVPHHGSKFSSSELFLEATRPNIALVSVGKNNQFGHPTSRVLMYLDTVGAKVLRTDELGTIELVVDNNSIRLAE
ncbi:ComEC/Rec2 family competence protein [Patescibacteria group bacterium]